MSKVDNLDKYVRFTTSVFGADKVHKIICYSLGVVGQGMLMKNGGKHTAVSEGLVKLGGEISMARMVTRFFGMTDALEAVKNDSWVGSYKDPRLKAVVRVQAWSMVFYNPIEHFSWIGYIAPKLIDMDAGKWTRVSCYFWAIYVILDFYAQKLRLDELDIVEAEKRKEITDASKEELRSLNHRRTEIKWNIVRDVLFLPNLIHWSVKGGIMPEFYVQVLGLAEALVGSWRMWKNM